MEIAQRCAMMGTCARRQVGCVLVDGKNLMLSTGFNGVPPKFPHCRGEEGLKCKGADSPSGTNLDGCIANHAEVNALIHCPDASRIVTVYTTSSPCVSCVKALLCTSAQRIVFLETYPHPEAKQLWTQRPQAEGHARSWEMIVEGYAKVIAKSVSFAEIQIPLLFT